MEQKKLLLRSLNLLSERILFVFALVCFCVLTHQANAQNDRPNIILILVDDADYKTLSCNGGKSYQTPNIDLMAQQGMNFTQCHASPVCSPSRTMLMTGKYNFRNYTKWGVLDTSQRTIANLLRDAGYSTACFGKWQFDGGDLSIRQFGFDSYCVFNAFNEDENTDYRYKSPTIYTNGAFVDKSKTLNKYGEDIFADSVIRFMKNHESNPFFIYYPMVLVHEPFQPTPDDADYGAWNKPSKSDTTYYSSMVTYMDKKVGEVLKAVKTLGIQNNTVVMFTCDNGTSSFIYEYEDGSIMKGGKGKTTEYGTHVPLIAYGPQYINPGTVNNDLIDFTDFFPTIASLAKINISPSYKPIDGVDFSPVFKSVNVNARTFIFNHYDEKPNITTIPKRWAQTATYKLYDTLGTGEEKFYNIVKDPTERSPLADSSLTPKEIKIKQQLLNTINSYVMQGFPLFKKPKVLSVTDSSATIMDSIEIDGGSTVYASGGVWDLDANPVIQGKNHNSSKVFSGVFISNIENLAPNTVYHFRTYAKNKAGTGYSDDISFTTLAKPPVALDGIPVNCNSFIAHWTKVDGSNYRIDVSTSYDFFALRNARLTEGFDNGTISPPGWVITSGIVANNTVFGIRPPSLQYEHSDKFISTAVLGGAATRLSFLTRAISKISPQLVVEAYNGLEWDTVGVVWPSSQEKQTIVYDLPPKKSFTQFKFTCIRDSGSIIIDDINISYKKQVSSMVPGFNNKLVNDTSIVVTGLLPNTTYYYRVRAEKKAILSSNSNVVSFRTCNSVANTGNANSSIKSDQKDATFEVQVSPNPARDKFSIHIQNASKDHIEIIITDVFGKKVYEATGNKDGNYIIGNELSAGIYFIKVMQGQNITTLKLVKQQ
jgi:arylsulfatase A